MSRKKGCVWSKFYWDDCKHLIRNMDSSLLGEVLKADLNYFFTGEIPDFPSEQQSLFEMIQEGIDESRENHESWCKNQKEATEAANEKRESESSQNCPTLGSFGVENKHEHEHEYDVLENNKSLEWEKEIAKGEGEGILFAPKKESGLSITEQLEQGLITEQEAVDLRIKNHDYPYK